MPAPASALLWAETRRHWEYDPDLPSFAQAAQRAFQGSALKAPGRSAVHGRAHREGWERKGASMSGVAVAAHRKADAIMDGLDAGSVKKGSPEGAALAALAREESENARAEVIARHRSEWGVIGELVDEALQGRAADPVEAFNRAKLAKISAETLAIRQQGERKAWGLDMPELPADLTVLTDAQLEALAAGKLGRYVM